MFRKTARPAAKPRQANLQMEALEARDNPAPYLPGKTFLFANFDINGQPVRQTHIQFSSETYRPDLLAQQVGFEYVTNDNTNVYAVTGTLEDTNGSPADSHLAFSGWLVDLGDGTNLVHLTATGVRSSRVPGLWGLRSTSTYTDDYNGEIDETGTYLSGSLYEAHHYDYFTPYYFSSDVNNYYTSNGIYIGDNINW
jgi:hypothetical protein